MVVFRSREVLPSNFIDGHGFLHGFQQRGFSRSCSSWVRGLVLCIWPQPAGAQVATMGGMYVGGIPP